MYYKPRAKSVISFLLSVLLFMTLLPVTVWAATLNVTDEAGLRTAILNANDGDIISTDCAYWWASDRDGNGQCAYLRIITGDLCGQNQGIRT